MLKLWDRQSNLTLPNGVHTSIMVFEEFPWAEHAEAVLIDVKGGIVSEISNYHVVADNEGIDEELDPAEGLEILKQKIKDRKKGGTNNV